MSQTVAENTMIPITAAPDKGFSDLLYKFEKELKPEIKEQMQEISPQIEA